MDRAYRDYQTDLDNLREGAADVIENMVDRDPLNVKDAIRDFSRDASQLANEYYDTVRGLWSEYAGVRLDDFDHTQLIDPDRALWQMQGGFNNTDYNGLTYTQVKNGQSRAGLTIDDLWPDLGNPDDAMQFVADMVNASARLTTQRNMRIDPSKPRWARVPRGARTCAFCTMLASRGFTYLSEDSAGLEMQYHRDCDCQIVPSWGRQTLAGYNPERLTAMWQEASKGGGDYRETLKRKRRDNPMAFTDGVYPTPTMPWEQSVRLLSMKGEPKGTAESWYRRQLAVGVDPSREILERHEIVFLEKFQKLGEEYEWIPKSHDGKPSNDFHWLSHECDAELKSPAGLKYRNVAQRINDAVVGGVEQGVVKDVFVLDFGSTKLPDKFVNQLSLYNARHESHIKELWVFDSEGFHQIVLK